MSLVALLASAVVSTAGAQTTATPALDVADLRPFVVRGTGFEPRERVVVWLLSGRTWSRAAVATKTGSFTARFATSLPRCHRFTLHAFGSHGSRARLHSGIQVACELEPPDR